MEPIRIQRSRQHKQISPNGLPIVYVGRPSKFGNPFKIGGEYEGEKGFVEIKTKEECVNLFSFLVGLGCQMNEYLHELKGKNLSCWCKIGEPCHADILLEIANQ